MGDDDRRIYDMVARRFLAVFHPEAVFENTRVETTVGASTSSARAASSCSCPGWRGVYGELADGRARARTRTTRARDQQLPQARAGRDGRHARGRGRRARRPSRRGATRDASLLGAMETAGKLVDDDELREAMKDSGIGTPATRAAIIERLIDVGYVERDGRALVRDREGPERDPPARRARADLARADRRLGAPPRQDRARRGLAREVHGRHRRFAEATVDELDATLKDVRIPRAKLGPCPVCGHDIVENRKGYSCWSREDPGCGFVIWKSQGRQDAAGRGRARADQDRAHREAGDRLQGPQRAARSAPSWRWSRPRRANGASSSTSRGPRRAPSRPTRRRPRRRGEAADGVAARRGGVGRLSRAGAPARAAG